jgi:hypothetical protein
MRQFIKIITITTCLSACATTETTPEADSTPDNAAAVREIQMLNVPPSQIKTYGKDPGPQKNLFAAGWANYRISDKKTGSIIILQSQVVPVTSDTSRFWLENRSIGRKGIFVTKSLVRVDLKKYSAALKGGTEKMSDVLFFEKLIQWNEGTEKATQVDDSMLQPLGFALTKLSPDLTVTHTDRRKSQVAAGTFNDCIVVDKEGGFLAGEATRECISWHVPTPHLVERESESARTELLQFGTGVKKSFIPPSVPVEIPEEKPGYKKPDIKLPF